MRALLAVRDGERSNRSLANIDAFLELARGYDVRGLKHFVRDIHRDWGSRQSRAEIAALRPGLAAEMPVFGTIPDSDPSSVAGRADAIFVENHHAKIVIDWKSDIEPSDADIALHAAQLRIYMRTIKVNRGALVYLSSGRVHWLVTDGEWA